MTTHYSDQSRQLLWSVVFLLLMTGIGGAQTITIASYNVENLFDMHHDGTEYTEYVPGRHGWSEAMLVKKIRNLTEVICDLEADVVALQEVENDRILARLQKSLKRAGCGYQHRAITSDRRTPIHNALLSKIPLKRTRDVRITRYGRQRSILEATLDTDPPLRVFNSHWRSKRGPESERIVYAKALAKRLAKLPTGAEYVLVGDFNSNYNESLTIDPKHNDTHNRTGLNDILHTMREGKMVRLHTLQAGEHCTLWMELPAGARWSHNFFGDKEGIDAIVIPPSLHDGQGWAYRSDSFRVFKPSYLFGRGGRVNRWAYKHHKHLGKGYSDHLPIVATFSTEGSTSPRLDAKPGWWQQVKGWWGSLWVQPDVPEVQRVVAKPTKKEPHTTVGTIGALKKTVDLAKPTMLIDACVIFKRRDSAVIQQGTAGEAILIYRAAMQLEEGHSYDLMAYKKKRYKGLDELTDIEVVKEKKECNVEDFVSIFSPEMMDDRRHIGRVVRAVVGQYGKRAIAIEGVRIPLHFQKRAGRPPKGARLRIDRAMIGYYKDHMELQVWDKKDWQ